MKLNLGTTIRELRRKNDRTQEELAALLGVTAQAVSRWESGEGYPDIMLLSAIAAYFDVTIDDLLDVGAARKVEKFKAYQAEVH
jgi:transcriptional regulator with XRE-family HTH domain